MKKKFEIGDTIEVLHLKISGIINDTDGYIDVYGDGEYVEDYWVINLHGCFRMKSLALTRVILIEKKIDFVKKEYGLPF